MVPTLPPADAGSLVNDFNYRVPVVQFNLIMSFYSNTSFFFVFMGDQRMNSDCRPSNLGINTQQWCVITRISNNYIVLLNLGGAPVPVTRAPGGG